jgi:hypothetical protein
VPGIEGFQKILTTPLSSPLTMFCDLVIRDQCRTESMSLDFEVLFLWNGQ